MEAHRLSKREKRPIEKGHPPGVAGCPFQKLIHFLAVAIETVATCGMSLSTGTWHLEYARKPRVCCRLGEPCNRIRAFSLVSLEKTTPVQLRELNTSLASETASTAPFPHPNFGRGSVHLFVTYIYIYMFIYIYINIHMYVYIYICI